MLGTKFGQNVLADEKAYALVLEGEADLAGLPDFLREAAAKAAADRDMPGKHVITLSRSLIEPFLQFSARRDLRETAFKAWIARGEGGGETDNREIIAEMVALRAERARAARLREFRRFPPRRHHGEDAGGGASACSTRCGSRPARRPSAKPAALQAMIAAEGGNFELAPWDWRYYSEQRRKAEFDFDEGEIKPYLALENIIQAAFYTAGRLFGLAFAERRDVPVHHPDVRAWEVTDRRRPPCRPLPRRLFRPDLQAERRLDERLPRAGKARRRHPPDRRQRDEFFQGGRGPAGAAELRRRADAVPRIRPRAARPPVGRDLPADRRHERLARFRRVPLAALRALAGAAGDSRALRRATGRRASRCRRRS